MAWLYDDTTWFDMLPSPRAPSNTKRKPTTSPENESEEQDNIHDASDEGKDDLCGTPIEVKTPEQTPAQVDQYGDPPESPEEFRMGCVKENGITGFMVKVAVN
ncbi:hypothetical protein INS49_007740 [Diaporthe citri]|uniref:uncharacterized protein n=1 Tax=Diaporthe citri TaxID=83186 RepID=UPI001C7EF30C|nr:uncharacterized protein INS49_007740 [Diaporthe citri]KAG6362648.1 hypothetical protein INS49_007740 [Diaporthe citri]